MEKTESRFYENLKNRKLVLQILPVLDVLIVSKYLDVYILVPIGFIYVQLPRQPEPRSIWSQITWQDVTSAYAGQFFRAEGSGSAPFGENQGDYTRQISDVETKSRDYNDNYPHSIQVPATGWSPWVRTSYDADEGALHYESARYYHPNVEVRPKNTAIRLWKRTA